jgi:chemotaxis protein methyltransferase CheR
MSDSGGALRIWSVGCSDGSELYSLAMLLAEQRILHRCYLLGTDCRADAIRRAATGAYDTAAVRGVPTGLLQRYFTFSGRDWRLHGWLRTAVQFRTANVLKIMEPGLFDLVLCRNMAIYLESDAVLQLWSGLEHSLRTGGVLVLGKAERPIGAKRLSAVAPCVYRRTRG